MSSDMEPITTIIWIFEFSKLFLKIIKYFFISEYRLQQEYKYYNLILYFYFSMFFQQVEKELVVYMN